MMATRERPPRRSEQTEQDDALFDQDALFGLDEDITEEDIEDFLAEQALEEEAQQKKPGFLNLQTGAGLAIIAIGVVYLLQQIGFFPLGFSLGTLVTLLPWLAGILIILTGFGVLSWSPTARRRKARERARIRRERAKKARAQREKTMGRSRERQRSGFEQARESARRAAREAGRAASRAASSASRRRAGKSRRLTKSRKGKITGVAAGIADYLGVDPTLIRIAFVIGAIFGNGFTIPLYFILSLVLPKADEDEEDDDDRVIRVVKG